MIRASYDLKLIRAEGHLAEIENSIASYVQAHPYELERVRSTGRDTTFRLRFKSQPDEMLGVAIGDFAHNVRSALDHLTAALVPAGRRHSVYFPIFYSGVWEPVTATDSEEQRKQKGQWATYTKDMDPRSIKVLQQAQPDPMRGYDPETLATFVGLSRINNQDKHRKLVVVSGSLLQPSAAEVLDTGEIVPHSLVEALDERDSFQDGATIYAPPQTTEMRISGTPVVSLQLSEDGLYVLPGPLRGILRDARTVIEGLRPFVSGETRRPGAGR